MTIISLVLLCCTAFGVIGDAACAEIISAPYSNREYACRCLPLFNSSFYKGIRTVEEGFAIHRKMCELRAYIRDFDAYQNFIMKLIDGDIEDVSAWFLSEAEKVSKKILKKINAAYRLNNLPLRHHEALGVLRTDFIAYTKNRSGVAPDLIKNLRSKFADCEEEMRMWGLSALFDYCLWLFGMEQNVVDHKEDIVREIRALLKNFPFDALREKIQCSSVAAVLDALQHKQSTIRLKKHWEILDFFSCKDDRGNLLFDAAYGNDYALIKKTVTHDNEELLAIEKRIILAYMALKDITSIVYSFCWYFTANLATTCVDAESHSPDKRSSVLSHFMASQHISQIQHFSAFFSYIEAMQIDTTIKEIERFVKRFRRALATLETTENSIESEESSSNESEENSDDSSEDKNDKTHITSWLQNRWVVLPLTTLVIVIKILIYFSEEKNDKDNRHLHHNTKKYLLPNEHEYKPKAPEEFYVQN